MLAGKQTEQRLDVVRDVKYEEPMLPAGVDRKEAAKVPGTVPKSASRLVVFWLKHLLRTVRFSTTWRGIALPLLRKRYRVRRLGKYLFHSDILTLSVTASTVVYKPIS